jgi:hypothetical protein
MKSNSTNVTSSNTSGYSIFALSFQVTDTISMYSSSNSNGYIGGYSGTYMNLYADDNDINNGLGFDIPYTVPTAPNFGFYLFPGETYRIIVNVQNLSMFNFTNTNTWSIPSSVLTNVQFHHKGPSATVFSTTTIFPDNDGSTAASRLTINFANPTTSNSVWIVTN